MKTKRKSLVWFISSFTGLAILASWLYLAKAPFDTVGYYIFGLSMLLIGFGLYFKLQTYKSEKAGLTSEDELSKRIKEKAAAKTFSTSICLKIACSVLNSLIVQIWFLFLGENEHQ